MNFVLGILIAFGCGTAIGAAMGKKSARQELGDYIHRNNLKVLDKNDAPFPIDEYLEGVQQTDEAETRNRFIVSITVSLIAVAAGLIVYAFFL